MNSSYTLLTGATGLLGQYLLKDLLVAGHGVAVLVRASKTQSARDRVEQTMQMWESRLGSPLPRPILLEGDINNPESLGLSEEQAEWVRNHCDRVMHSAASLSFTKIDATNEPYRTNIGGTENVLRFMEEQGLVDMHYISTAYVCGHRTDRVMEDDLDVGQEFRNDYEKSKNTAERLVRDAKFLNVLTIYRPVVITGDSETGYTSTYHGSYLYMKMARVLANNFDPDENGKRHIPVRWGLTGDERRNITPVEWNSTIIAKLFNNPEAHGQTFHMAPRDPISMREAMQVATDFYGITGIEFCGYGFKEPDPPLTDFERWLWANISIYGSYDFMDPEFDTTNLDKFAPEPQAPRIDLEVGNRLMKYAEEDRWGKRKPEPLTPAAMDVFEYLRPWLTVTWGDSNDGQESATVIGVELLGPGGGPWTLRFDDSRLVSVSMGLPSSADGPAVDLPIAELTVQQFAHLTKAGSLTPEKLLAFIDSQSTLAR